MPIHSLNKGKRAERSWAKFLTSLGFTAQRGRQYSGSPNSPDVVCEALQGLHCEVKAVEKLNLQDAMAQAIRDSYDKLPYVAHKKNRGEWLVTLRAKDLIAFSLLITKASISNDNISQN